MGGSPYLTASRDGREARKAGQPIDSNPYTDVPVFRAFRRAWFDGWRAMDSILSNSTTGD
jgi:hypothetical protein